MSAEIGGQAGVAPGAGATLPSNAATMEGVGPVLRGAPRRGLAGHVAGRVARRVLQLAYRQRYVLAAVVVLAILGIGFLLWRMAFQAAAAAVGIAPVETSVETLEARGNTAVVVLKEARGTRRLSVPVQETEARVIARHGGQRVPGDQPAEYEIMRDLVGQLGGRIDHVIVHEANRSQAFAHVVLSAEGMSRRVIRVQGGDGVALALTTSAPIFVEEAILAEYGR